MRRFDYSTDSLLLALTVSYASAHLIALQLIYGDYVFAYLRAIFLFVFIALMAAKGVRLKEFLDKAIDLAKPKCSILFVIAIALTAVVLRVLVFNVNHESTLSITARGLVDHCIVAPLNEELLFRGIVLTALLRNMKSAVIAIAISAAFFASCHNLRDFLHFIPLFLGGCLYGIAFYVTRSISIPVALHSIWNIGGFVNVSIGW
ncbi:CPBP family intramembrane glutamic endopeptidase [Uliginosibacterium sp. TH139]|uniref:CPBP family intramembrane glutamic endopeptidase n=1 Tax=Uliginosibacterium sp. TH139 TaxID=2067453 RepID=UPI000C7ABE13|nr:CPBP family intramembrane glutamic endopeptidase [Uliginosibacterium sp. TH139]PLK46957.1 hypothetical protein C0V76_19245 [Uliginosibacterium sp. TH139]